MDRLTSVGLVGGGRGGTELYEIFTASDSVKIEFVADRDTHAPAVKRAKREGVPTFADIETALRSAEVDIIVEATGSSKVLDSIRSAVQNGTEVVSNGTALMLFNVLQESRAKTNGEIFLEVRSIGERIDAETEQVNGALSGIRDVADNIDLLALNASIEAAHAAEHGRGFSVVAQAVRKTSEKSRALIDVVERVTREIAELSKQIHQSLKKLQ